MFHFLYFHKDQDNTKIHPDFLKIKLGLSGSLNCESSKDTQWIFFDCQDLNVNVFTNFHKTSIEINSFSLENAGKYTCYGFDPYLLRYFVADANVVAIGKYILICFNTNN